MIYASPAAGHSAYRIPSKPTAAPNARIQHTNFRGRSNSEIWSRSSCKFRGRSAANSGADPAANYGGDPTANLIHSRIFCGCISIRHSRSPGLLRQIPAPDFSELQSMRQRCTILLIEAQLLRWCMWNEWTCEYACACVISILINLICIITCQLRDGISCEVVI